MKKYHSLSIFGSSSDAGKSTISFAITHIFNSMGLRVAPFKAQNVSNNSLVCDDGGEIAIPQAFCASSIGLKISNRFNPILLKSGQKNSASVLINGYEVSQQDVREYYRDIDKLKPFVKNSFNSLLEEFEFLVAEGAGSPVELNLMDKDLSNIYIAKEFNTKIILVADIERGGVFASIYGVYNLLPKELQKNVIGVIINKFRGDITLFDDGVNIIEKDFGLKVLGVVPYKTFNLGFEDMQSLENYSQTFKKDPIKVSVIKLPHISNFTDFEPLVSDQNIELIFTDTLSHLSSSDMIIIPGTKRVVEDLEFLKSSGIYDYIQNTQTLVFGICGGYEMMHTKILDPQHIESDKDEFGFGFFDADVVFKDKKCVKKGVYTQFNLELEAYEIHYAKSKNEYNIKDNYMGTFLHGIFENDNFREFVFSKISKEYKPYSFKTYKEKSIDEFSEHIKNSVDVKYIVKELEFEKD